MVEVGLESHELYKSKRDEFFYFDSILFYFFNIILLVDAFNGYFINMGTHLPIAQVYKLGLIFLLIIRLISFPKERAIVFFIILYVVMFILLYLMQVGMDQLLETLIHLSKFFFLVISFLYLKRGLVNNQSFFYQKINYSLKVNVCVLATSILLGTLGFGFSTYGESSVGSKGYFNGGNDLGAVLIILFSFYIYKITYDKLSSVKRNFIMFFFLMVALVNSTKLSILGTVISIAVLPGLLTKKHKKIATPIGKKLMYVVFLVIISAIVFFAVEKLGMLKRWEGMYSKSGLLFLLTSGRLKYVGVEIYDYLDSTIIQHIFGLGGDRTVEMDFFDVLLNYGALGVVLIYSFFIYLYSSAKRNKGKKIFPFAPYVVFINVLLAIVSFIAGHVIFSAMAGIFISMVNALAFYKEYPIAEDKQEYIKIRT